eukprot:15464377-Alexandrium_andersonii.AAC.1
MAAPLLLLRHAAAGIAGAVVLLVLLMLLWHVLWLIACSAVQLLPWLVRTPSAAVWGAPLVGRARSGAGATAPP